MRRPRVPGLSLAPAFALGFMACAAHAMPEPGIPPACGTRAELERQLRARLGDDPALDALQVSIHQAASGYHLRVQLGSELRELDDPSCAELFRASVVVAVAMLMQGREPAPAAPPVAPRSPAPFEPPRFTLTGGVGVNAGTLPQAVPTFELEGEALWRRLGVTWNVRFLWPTQELDEHQQGVKLWALGAGVSGVFRPSRTWQARLGFAAQRLAGSGSGSTHNGDDHVWAAGPTLGLAFIPLQSDVLWAGLGAEGQLNAVRGRFEILNYSHVVSSSPHAVYQVSWLAADAFVRLGWVW